MSTIDGIKTHPQYNPDTLRIHLSFSELRNMPTKSVNSEELYELKCNADYNPTAYYEHEIPLYVGEVGHDLVYRYLLTR